MHKIGYKHLNYQQRCQILAFWKAGHKQCDIAKEIGLHESTISRELKRNITFVCTKLGSWQYKLDYAQGNANQRHKEKNKFIKFTDEAKIFVREKLQQNWSPDQISGYAKLHHFFFISGEWIYQFILKDKMKGGKLYLHRRCQNKKYRKRCGSPKRYFILLIHSPLGAMIESCVRQ